MRNRLVALLFALLLAAPVAAQQVISETGIGYVAFEGNEQTVGSKVDDPAKVRVTVSITEHGGGGGVISFNASRIWGAVQFGGNQTEMAMLRVEQAEDVRGQVGNPKAEFNFLCNVGGTDDAAMRKCLSFTYDGITAISPGIANSIRGIAGGMVGGTGTSRMASPHNGYWLQLQDDGNYVIYDVSNPEQPRPVFDLWWLMFTLQQMGHPYPYAH